MEVKLFTNTRERERFENLADVYAIIVTLEHLEKAFIRDAIKADAYTPACLNLIAQYKTGTNLISDVWKYEDFAKEYNVSCPAAEKRLRIGVPATIEHATASTTSESNTSKYVAEVVQHFITLMDSLKLNLVAVDQIHPLLSDLMQSLARLSTLPASFAQPRDTLRNWLVHLNRLRASDTLDDKDVRQLLFDLEAAHQAFYRSLSS